MGRLYFEIGQEFQLFWAPSPPPRTALYQWGES